MSKIQRLILPGLVSVFALAACTQNPYDTEYDPYGRARHQQPSYGTQPTTSPTGVYNTQPAPPYAPPSSQNPYGPTTPPGGQPPNPYGSLQPAPDIDPPVSPPVTRTTADYPVAERTQNPGFVVSPYAPNRVIDVTAWKSGDLVKDPDNKKIFRVP